MNTHVLNKYEPFLCRSEKGALLVDSTRYTTGLQDHLRYTVKEQPKKLSSINKNVILFKKYYILAVCRNDCN